MLVNNGCESDKNDTFYGPISKYAYLTPLQRKKLREKRKLEISSPEEVKEADKPIKSKKFRKLNPKLCPKKLNYKANKNEPLCKKLNKVNTPEIRCTAAQVLSHNNYISPKKKKFFKSRSPEHLKKMNFVVPLIYKKSRLDFGDDMHSKVMNYKSINSQNNSSVEPPENSEIDIQNHSEICSSFALNPLIIKVTTNERKAEAVILNELAVSDENNLLSSDKSSSVLTSNFDGNFEVLNVNSNLEENSVIESNMCDTEITSAGKLYPIFNFKNTRKEECVSKTSLVKKSFTSKDKSKGSEQMIIDAGQKEIGAKECQICKMPYTIGHPEDEKLHSQYHDNYLKDLNRGLKYPGWEREIVIGSYDDGIVIKLNEKHFKLKKFQDVLTLANRDLGIPNTDLPVKINVICLLFISKDGRVRGCLVAESITSASPMILHHGTWCASSESVNAICGINRIWVAKEYRRHKVASRLIDCLRSNFIFGYAISVNELAFTDPTINGREFAAFYTGTDNFLVYK